MLQPKIEVVALKVSSNLSEGAHRERDREEIPSSLAHEIMLRSLTCTPYFQQHRRCMNRRLRLVGNASLPRNARAWVDEYLLEVAGRCEEEQEEQDTDGAALLQVKGIGH